MSLPRSCRVCGKVGRAVCAQHDNRRPSNSRDRGKRAYSDSEYQRNRKIMIDIAWQQGRPCVKCAGPFEKKSDITAEHLVPVRSGGTGALGNLGPCHHGCNSNWRTGGLF
jgi:hypothetical protein